MGRLFQLCFQVVKKLKPVPGEADNVVIVQTLAAYDRLFIDESAVGAVLVLKIGFHKLREVAVGHLSDDGVGGADGALCYLYIAIGIPPDCHLRRGYLKCVNHYVVS